MASCEITALALDMDGTLLTSEKRVTDDTRVTLRALLERGLSIFAVTGKAPEITARCLAPLRLPMVCLDGAVHVAGGVQQWVDDATIEDRLAARLLHDCGGPCYLLADGATQVRGAVDEVQYVDWSDQVGKVGADPLHRVTHLVFTGRERARLATVRRRVLRLAREAPGAGSALPHRSSVPRLPQPVHTQRRLHEAARRARHGAPPALSARCDHVHWRLGERHTPAAGSAVPGRHAPRAARGERMRTRGNAVRQ